MESKTHDVPNGHPPNHRSPALRILVVEDHADTAASQAMLLRLHGYEVQVARDGPTALQMVSATPPDVILLDIGLPKMDGWLVAKQIAQQGNGKRPFLIALTGYGMEADRLRSREAGIDLHLVKPVDNDLLEKTLRELQAFTMPSAERSIESGKESRNRVGSLPDISSGA